MVNILLCSTIWGLTGSYLEGFKKLLRNCINITPIVVFNKGSIKHIFSIYEYKKGNKKYE